MSDESESDARPVAAVVILAAGEGKRMHSSRSKLLHEIAGHSMLSYAVAAAISIQPEHIVVVVGHQRDQVESHLAEIAPHVMTAVQEQQLGTGHAVQVALEQLADLTGDVVVTYGDVPLLTARDPGRPGGRSPRPVGGGDRAVRSRTRSEWVRTHPAQLRRSGRGDRGAPGRRRDPAGHHRDQLGDLRLRRRRPPVGPGRADPDQCPGRALPDRRAHVCSPVGPDGQRLDDRRSVADGRGQRSGAAVADERRAEPADPRGLDAQGGDGDRPGLDLGTRLGRPRPRRHPAAGHLAGRYDLGGRRRDDRPRHHADRCRGGGGGDGAAHPRHRSA